MKPSMDWLEYQQLEQTIPYPPQPHRQRVSFPSLTNFWAALFHQVVRPPELQIWQTHDDTGHTWWSGYDPATGRSIEHVSETQIRIWVEQRYR